MKEQLTIAPINMVIKGTPDEIEKALAMKWVSKPGSIIKRENLENSTLEKVYVVYPRVLAALESNYKLPDEIPFVTMKGIKFLMMADGITVGEKGSIRFAGTYAILKGFGSDKIDYCKWGPRGDIHQEEFDAQDDVVDKVYNSFLDASWAYFYELYSTGDEDAFEYKYGGKVKELWEDDSLVQGGQRVEPPAEEKAKKGKATKEGESQPVWRYEKTKDGCTITQYNGTDACVEIPASLDGMPVHTVGYSAFMADTSAMGRPIRQVPRAHKDWLKTNLLTVIIPEGVTTIQWAAFKGCASLREATFPQGLKKIDSHAFENCSGLTSVVIPDSVERIEMRAFAGCTGLASITIPNKVSEIMHAAFCNCSNMKSVVLTEGVTYIGQEAFQCCSSLTRIVLPESVITIDYSAFRDCTSLTKIDIPASVTTIGTAISNPMFDGCSSLKSIEVAASNVKYASIDGVVFDKDKSILVRYPAGRTGAYRVPDGVTQINFSAFKGCIGITDVTIPESVKDIGERAFFCDGSLNAKAELRTYISVAKPGDHVFMSCPNVVIHAPAGSYAERYAKKKGIRLIIE